jgi:glycosyltransferase involved in cell wall biosynthesis
MNVLFVNYGDFTSNSLNHIAGFARVLHDQGHACAVAVPDASIDSISSVAEPRFIPVTYADAVAQPRLFPDGRAADILHAWTPRDLVRKIVVAHQLAAPARLIVHFEDNEKYLVEAFSGKSFAALEMLDVAECRRILTAPLVHPRRIDNLARLADGVTFIVDRLRCFAPPETPALLLEPGVDAELYQPQPADIALRRELGLHDDERLVVFTGGTSFANTPEVRTLYDAVVLLNQRGVRTRLVRTGLSSNAFQSTIPPEVRAFVLDLGFVAKCRLPKLLALADVLVQPGCTGPFNDYRLPSKLPEFLAMGKPVVLPASNIGRKLRDGVDALLLHSGAPAEIADCCQRVFDDAALANTLGKNGAAFARAHFDLVTNTTRLLRFYEEVLARPAGTAWQKFQGAGTSDVVLLADRALSGGADVGPDRIAHVLAQIRLLEEEFADSLEQLEELSESRRRLEEAQRKQSAQIAAMEADLLRCREKIERMQRSPSWKMTSPLRALRRALFDRKR